MNDIVRIANALDFAARKHADQKRKGVKQEPYVNHLIEVANLLAEATAGVDPEVVMAGLLHDTIEDQAVGYEELVESFGKVVADLVKEVTDDKSLPKGERKQLQIDTAPMKSRQAKMLKIADKTSNLRSLVTNPPDWPAERKEIYFLWARSVVAGCRGVNPTLEAGFDEAFKNGVNAGLVSEA